MRVEVRVGVAVRVRIRVGVGVGVGVRARATARVRGRGRVRTRVRARARVRARVRVTLWRREAREAVAQAPIKAALDELRRERAGDQAAMAQRRVHQGVLRWRRSGGHGRQLAAHPLVTA